MGANQALNEIADLVESNPNNSSYWIMSPGGWAGRLGDPSIQGIDVGEIGQPNVHSWPAITAINSSPK